MTACSNDDVLAAFIAGMLDGQATADVSAHVEACPVCEAIVRAVAESDRSEQLLSAVHRATPFVGGTSDVLIRYRDDLENARRHPASTLALLSPHKTAR